MEFSKRDIERLIDLESLKLTEEDLVDVPSIRPHFFDADDEDPAKSLLRYMRDIKNVEFTGRHVFNYKLMPHQIPIIQSLYSKKFSLFLGARGFSKTTCLAFYALYMATFQQGVQIVLTGAGFRQAKLIIDAIEKIISNAPVLQSMFPGEGIKKISANDRSYYRIGASVITALPMGDGSTIRGQRAQIVIVDEFGDIQRDIFETVIRGFGVVSQNPNEEVRSRARIEVLKRLGVWSDELEEKERVASRGNQLIVAGTAKFQFNHFYEYYKNWKRIIESRGDLETLRTLNIDTEVDWRDYGIIRLPWKAAPPGYYQDAVIRDARQSMTELNFLMEYECVFPADSAGFFPMSLIRSCTTDNPIIPYECNEEIRFKPMKSGSDNCHYIYGIDPAHSEDSLAIVILEVHPTYRKIVHCWSINKTAFRERERSAGEDLNNYYAFCARKIRNLMKLFPTNILSIDAQGGGYSLMEALGDISKLEEGEFPILPIAEGHTLHPGKRIHPDEDKPGLHIVELVQFRDLKYTVAANTGLRKDFEDKALLLPYWDQAGIAVDCELNNLWVASKFDTYEDLCREIEEIKNELATIVITQTTTGADHWDTPEIKNVHAKKGRMRKDRYSALLMANYAARRMVRQADPERMPSIGVAVGVSNFTEETLRQLPAAQQPDWFSKGRAELLKLMGVV